MYCDDISVLVINSRNEWWRIYLISNNKRTPMQSSQWKIVDFIFQSISHNEMGYVLAIRLIRNGMIQVWFFFKFLIPLRKYPRYTKNHMNSNVSIEWFLNRKCNLLIPYDYRPLWYITLIYLAYFRYLICINSIQQMIYNRIS